MVTAVDQAVMKLMDLKENDSLHTRKFLQNYNPENKGLTVSVNKTVTLSGLGPDTVDFKGMRTTALLGSIIYYISERFADFMTELLSCFTIFNYELRPSDVTDLARHERQEVQTLLDFFSESPFWFCTEPSTARVDDTQSHIQELQIQGFHFGRLQGFTDQPSWQASAHHVGHCTDAHHLQ